MAFHRKDRFNDQLQLASMAAHCLAHPARMKILEILTQNGETQFSFFRKILPLSRASIYHHLEFLRSRGVIEVSEQVPMTFYRLSEENFPNFRRYLGTYLNALE